MDWALAIKRNSEALNGIVAALFAMLGLAGDALVARIPRSLHSAVLRQLRPTESAVRRLIIIAARGLVVKLTPSRAKPAGPRGKSGPIRQGGPSRPAFQLFDTRKDFAELRPHRVKYAKYPPRIHFFGPGSKVDDLWPGRPSVAARPLPPDDLVNAERLARRLQAVKLALEDLPRQAKRFARWRVRRENAPSPKFRSPLRPGPPPGRRRKPVHLIDEVLVECHALAWEALKPDTS